MKHRWNEYVRELFSDQRPETLNLLTDDEGPTILKNEIECSVRIMKKGKADGEDGIAQGSGNSCETE